MPPRLHVTTYNIHKGFSPLNSRLMLHDLREGLRDLGSDIVFLQEVQGLHHGHARRHHNWPGQPQHEFLAEAHWLASAYGHNMIYEAGHHGNAVLSRFPIAESYNQDVTHLHFERRGLLHCRIDVPDGPAVHCVCVHLSLFGRSRRHQMAALVAELQQAIPADAPLIVAGDFNDWHNQAKHHLVDHLGLSEAFVGQHGQLARSFPAIFPLFRLDRIYVRGLVVEHCEVHRGKPWARLSDHAALSAYLRCEAGG